MTATVESPRGTKPVEFPPHAKAYLEAFYKSHQMSNDTSVPQKIRKLREIHRLDRTVIAADMGIPDAESELKALEIYILAEQGLI